MRAASRAVLLLVILTATSPAAGQVPGVAPRLNRQLAGEIRCVRGRPETVLPIRQLSGLARAENIRHEATHRSQFAADCEATARRWTAEPLFRLELEAEATCRGITVYPDTSFRRARQFAALTVISRTYGNAVAFGEIYDALARWCVR